MFIPILHLCKVSVLVSVRYFSGSVLMILWGLHCGSGLCAIPQEWLCDWLYLRRWGGAPSSSLLLVTACWLFLPPCQSQQPPCSAVLFLIFNLVLLCSVFVRGLHDFFANLWRLRSFSGPFPFSCLLSSLHLSFLINPPASCSISIQH